MQKVEEREAITLINKNQKIFGVLHRPLVKGNVPAVLICSGFAGNKCGKFRSFVNLGQELASQGIAVLRFDYRGAGDSEGDFRDITLDAKVSDTLVCLDFLTQDAQIDPKRIGLLGRSLGGAIAVLATRQWKQKIKSLALWAPVFDSVMWQDMWKAYQAQARSSSISPKEESLPLPPTVPNLQFLEQFFNLNIEKELSYLKHIPLLHIQAEHDTIVRANQAEGYKRAREGVESTRFIHLPNSDHDFSDFADQKIAIMETCLWYQQTL